MMRRSVQNKRLCVVTTLLIAFSVYLETSQVAILSSMSSWTSSSLSSTSTKSSESASASTIDTSTATSIATTNKLHKKYEQQHRPNILWIITDQQRFDAIRHVQDDKGVPHIYGHYNKKQTKNKDDDTAATTTTTKIRTPNLNKLSNTGAYFRTVYCQCPVCGPARTSLRTGRTIEQTGVQSNGLAAEYHNTRVFEERVKSLIGIDHILDNAGYQIEYYGKWHMPDVLYRDQFDWEKKKGTSSSSSSSSSNRPIIQFNDYDYETDTFFFRDVPMVTRLRSYLDYFSQVKKMIPTRDMVSFEDKQQQDIFMKYPYTPILIDSRYGMPTNTKLIMKKKGETSHNDQSREVDGIFFEEYETTQPNICGNFSLSKNYTPSHFIGETASLALHRLLIQQQKRQNKRKRDNGTDSQQDDDDGCNHGQERPFFITASFHNPHPPMIPAWEHLQYYLERQDTLPVPPNIDDIDINDSGYISDAIKMPRYADETAVRQWTAAYYALVEEIDEYIGQLMDTLRKVGGEETYNNTMIIFTSDHGEMLGAHGSREKNNFFEESVRVPLIVSYPNQIKAGTIVDEPVSHLDVVATILDYAGIVGSSTTGADSSGRNKNSRNGTDNTDDGDDKGSVMTTKQRVSAVPNPAVPAENNFDNNIENVTVRNKYVNKRNLDNDDQHNDTDLRKLTSGKSLRRFIEKTSYNEHYDEEVVIAEWDYRRPTDHNTLTRSLDQSMAFMVRKDNYKLMIRKKKTIVNQNKLDTLFDLSIDPYETTNLVGKKHMDKASWSTIGKAEYLRCLLLDWMERMDTINDDIGDDDNDNSNNNKTKKKVRYYSDPEANYGEGEGDIIEVRDRQSWPSLRFWMSHSDTLSIGRPVRRRRRRNHTDYFVRREYLYFGSRLPPPSSANDDNAGISGSTDANMNEVVISSIGVDGRDKQSIQIDTVHDLPLTPNQCYSIQITYTSPPIGQELSSSTSKELDAYLLITLQGREEKPLKVVLELV